MNIRAIIFDVYGTLLEVGPAPAEAEVHWMSLFRDLLQSSPRLSRQDFIVACAEVIARDHQASRTRGILWPEVQWPSVVAEVLPELARLSHDAQEEFLFRQIQTSHTTSMTIETAATMRCLQQHNYLLGIASNAQGYTLRELRNALARHGLELDMFENDLCFWSFEHGFSKPDPHVFQILNARLGARGVQPAEILMVGDRLDNDIEPARACGWQTWRLATGPAEAHAGCWEGLRHRLGLFQPAENVH